MTDSDPQSGHIAPEELAAISEPGAGLPAEWLTAHLAKCRYCMAIYAEFARARVESLATTPDAVDPALIATALEIPVDIPVEIAARSTVAPVPRSRRGAVTAAVAAGIVGAVVATGIWMQSKPAANTPATPTRSVAGLLYSNHPVPLATGLRGGSEAADLEVLRRTYDSTRSSDAAFDLIAGFLAAERFRDADPFLREALQAFPGESRFHNLAAIHAYQNSELARAERELRIAIAIQDESYLLVNLAAVLHEQGRTSEGEVLLARVVERDPTAPIADLARARAPVSTHEPSGR